MNFIKYLFSYRKTMDLIDDLEGTVLKVTRANDKGRKFVLGLCAAFKKEGESFKGEDIETAIKNLRERKEKLEVQTKEAENMMENYKQSLAQANANIETLKEIVTIRDQELQEWDDINTDLNKRIKELEGKTVTKEQQKAAERFRSAFDEILHFNAKIAVKGK